MRRLENCTERFLEENLEAGRGGKTALIEVEPGARRSVTYAELFDDVARAGIFLRHHLPAGSGARVMIAGRTSIETIVFWLATMRIGHVAVLVHPEENRAYYDKALIDVQPGLALAEDGIPGTEFSRMPSLETLRRAIMRPCRMPPVRVGHPCAALALLSSGSTGGPKVCVHHHAALRIFRESVSIPLWKMTSEDRVLGTSGPHFSFGLQAVHAPLSVGATAILQKAFVRHSDFLDSVESEKATVMLAVPTLYHLLWQRQSRPYELRSLRMCLSASERLPDLVRQRWAELSGSLMIDSIGTTETFLPFLSQTVDRPTDGLQRLDAFEYQPNDRGAPGAARAPLCSLMLRSAVMMCGTFRDGQLRRRDPGAWFDTADVFEQQATGLRFVSRESEGFKSGGQWVFPHRLEDVLLNLPGVALAAAAPVETPEGLMRLRAYVVLTGAANAHADAESWLSNASEAMRQLRPKALKPDRIIIVDALPMTRTGKIRRSQLACPVAGELIAPLDSSPRTRVMTEPPPP